MITCTRDIHWCSGHRVMGHENKCAHLHGHNYCAEITAAAIGTEGQENSPAGARARTLDSIGRVIDFSVIKEMVGAWIENHLDHGFVLHAGDKAAIEAMNTFIRAGAPQKLLLMESNPTAENIAQMLMNLGNGLLAPYGVRIVKMVVHETPNCRAEVNYQGA